MCYLRLVAAKPIFACFQAAGPRFADQRSSSAQALTRAAAQFPRPRSALEAASCLCRPLDCCSTTWDAEGCRACWACRHSALSWLLSVSVPGTADLFQCVLLLPPGGLEQEAACSFHQAEMPRCKGRTQCSSHCRRLPCFSLHAAPCIWSQPGESFSWLRRSCSCLTLHHCGRSELCSAAGTRQAEGLALRVLDAQAQTGRREAACTAQPARLHQARGAGCNAGEQSSQAPSQEPQAAPPVLSQAHRHWQVSCLSCGHSGSMTRASWIPDPCLQHTRTECRGRPVLAANPLQ